MLSDEIFKPECAFCNWILGDSISIDVATIFHDSRFVKYNLSFLGYGFYGDCVLDSEANRWMGPKRYDWEGVCVLWVLVLEVFFALVPIFVAVLVFILITANISAAYN